MNQDTSWQESFVPSIFFASCILLFFGLFVAKLGECCSKLDCKNSQADRAKCINGLEDSTKECAIAIGEEKDFLCGIQTEHACGKFYNEPLEFIECIEREKPCANLE